MGPACSIAARTQAEEQSASEEGPQAANARTDREAFSPQEAAEGALVLLRLDSASASGSSTRNSPPKRNNPPPLSCLAVVGAYRSLLGLALGSGTASHTDVRHSQKVDQSTAAVMTISTL